jgi:N-acetylglucosaminyldiphosphoundecaprenol N-acetyl-beta-D-mannosaminyltransferase
MPGFHGQRRFEDATEPGSPEESSAGAAYRILGVRVDAVQIPGVIARMEHWIARRDACRFIAVADMHSIMEALHSRSVKSTLEAADMVVPDGFPLVWFARRKGFALHRRVYGPQLMAVFCEQSVAKGCRHFFYGGAPGVAENLATCFCARFPGLQVAGVHTPPFRPLTTGEDREEVAKINSARADVVWVGLGAPKQERWMHKHRNKLNAPVLVGVGAAFDFHTGRVPQAPAWMGDHGLEWFYRLMMEPRRLWRRYLIHGSEFAALVLLDLLGVRKFD